MPDTEKLLGRSLEDLEFEEGDELVVTIGDDTAPLTTDVRIGDGQAQKGRKGEFRDAPAAQSRQVIFADRLGGRHVAGIFPGNPRTSPPQSWLVGDYGFSSVTFDPFNRGDTAWGRVITALRELFSPFNAEVTDVRPASGDYIQCTITSSSGSVLGCGCAGVAPMSGSCALLPSAICYVFTPGIGTERRVAEIAAQEIGHAIGLDHELLCTDPMSYLSCGATRAFQDQFVACGESQARRCACGGGSQNSFMELVRKLGPNAPLPPGNATISFINPTQQEVFLQGNREIEITADVTDPEGVSKVELLWDFTGKALDCAAGGNGVDWSCTSSGNRYTWKLDVGTGDRTYRVRVTDDQRPNGGVTTSPTRTIHLTSDPPPVCSTPQVRFLDMPSGTKIAAGNSVEVRAYARDISDVSEIREVQLVWLEPDGLARFIPMLRESADVWKVTMRLPARAQVGSRHLCLRASTFTGESKLTEHMHLEVAAGDGGVAKKGSDKQRQGRGRKKR
jgi:hypothetical protein